MIQKELRLYFVSFSNFLVFAGVVGVVLFIFFNNFYLTNTAQLNQLFDLFPWAFALLVPAVTMGVMAQERKTQTLRYLLSSPIGEKEIVIGKFLGALAFLSIFPLLTLILPISLNSVAGFDWGVILSSYLAVFLLLGLYLSVNIFVSSLFTNQLAAFVLSFLANFVLILLGGDLLNNVFPASFTQVLAQLSPLSHYYQITRGLIASADILYFLAVIVGFVFLSHWQLINIKFIGSPRRLLTLDYLSTGTIGVAIIVLSYFALYVPGQIDITQQRIFTLAEGTKTIVQDLPETITIDFYMSRDLPPAFQPRVDDVNRLLDQIARLNPEKLVVNRKYPLEEATVAQEANGFGIFPQAFSVYSQSEYQAKEGYLGLNISYADDYRTVPFVDDTSDLEYQVMSRVYEMTLTEKPVVVYLKPEGGVDLSQDAQTLMRVLGPVYDVKTVDLPSIEADSRLASEDLDGSIVLITDLNTELHPDDISLIREKVAQGTSLLVFDNGVDIGDMSLEATARDAVYINSLISDWGITIEKDLVYDLENPNLLTFGSSQGQVLVTYPFWPSVGVNQDIPLLTDLGGVVLPWPSSLTISDSESAAVHSLLFTGNNAGTQVDTFDVTPQGNLSRENLEQEVVGAIKTRGNAQGAVVVVGSANIIKDGYNSGQNNNLLFLNQIFDLASQSDSLTTIRVKNRLAPQLVFNSKEEKERLKYLNLGGIPLLALVVGGGFLYFRKRSKV